jgi:hypothetical protein
MGILAESLGYVSAVLFSDKGLRDNRQLYAFLGEHYFEIEYKAFPKRPRNETMNQRNSLCWWQENVRWQLLNLT